VAPGARAPEPLAGGWLVGALLVVLAPLFLAWELATGLVRAVVALADGLALRVRTAGRALGWSRQAGARWATLAPAVSRVARRVRRWVGPRRRIVAAAAEARGRFLAARLRV